MSSKTNFNETKVVTGMVRFSYLKVLHPEMMEGQETPKYSVSLIIPKTDETTLTAIRKAINTAATQGRDTKFGGKIPPAANLSIPLRDGDTDRSEDAAYANSFFINAKSTLKPTVYDKNLNEIITPEEIYSGCYGRASVSFYPFNTKGKRGIAAALIGIQKLKEGEPLGINTNSRADFENTPYLGSDVDDDGSLGF
jgi:hypothetical protein